MGGLRKKNSPGCKCCSGDGDGYPGPVRGRCVCDPTPGTLTVTFEPDNMDIQPWNECRFIFDQDHDPPDFTLCGEEYWVYQHPWIDSSETLNWATTAPVGLYDAGDGWYSSPKQTDKGESFMFIQCAPGPDWYDCQVFTRTGTQDWSVDRSAYYVTWYLSDEGNTCDPFQMNTGSNHVVSGLQGDDATRTDFYKATLTGGGGELASIEADDDFAWLHPGPELA